MKNAWLKKLALVLGFVTMPLLGWCDKPEGLDTGDTAWMLISTALVAMMTPAGLAIFYAGLAPSRNALNTMGMSYVSYALGTVLWVAAGFTLAFGQDIGGWIGSPDNLFLSGISAHDLTGSIPTMVFVAFQGTFAAIAVALVSGSVIERMKFSSWIIFSSLWSLLIYAPLAHWVWGGGFLFQDGSLDFAGGTVIHINAGVSGLVVALLLGKRKGDASSQSASSIQFAVLGAALLWFGWFGFNGGSSLAADTIGGSAVMNTNVAAATGVLGWMLLEFLFTGKATMFGAASGAVAGLVGITPAAGFVDVPAAVAIGFLAGVIGHFGVYEIKKMFGIDDALDVFGVHGLVGIWGAIATGIFANPDVNALGTGMWYGNPGQVLIQLKAVGVTVVYAAVMTVACYYLTSLLTKGCRVDDATEKQGLDIAFHGEEAHS